MALTVWGGSGDDFNLAGWQDPNCAVFPTTGDIFQCTKGARWSQATHFCEGRDPDSQLNAITGFSATLLLSAQTLVIKEFQCACCCQFVVTRVIGKPRNCCVGELFVLNPVFTTKFHGFHAKLCGKFVHDSLDCIGRFRSTSTAICISWCGVGEHACALEVVGIHFVNTRIHKHAKKRDPWSNDLQVSAHVGLQVNF